MSREEHPSYGDSALERFHDMPRTPRFPGILTDHIYWHGRLSRMREIADRYDSMEGIVQIDELLTGLNQMAFDYETDDPEPAPRFPLRQLPLDEDGKRFDVV